MQTDPLLLDRAKATQRTMTEPETRLWLVLRGKRLHGVKFARQVVVDGYTRNFVRVRIRSSWRLTATLTPINPAATDEPTGSKRTAIGFFASPMRM